MALVGTGAQQSTEATVFNFNSFALLDRLQARPKLALTTVLALVVAGCVPLISRAYARTGSSVKSSQNDAIISDPGLLKKHSTSKSFYVPSTGFTYPSIRVYYRNHPQADKLPATPRPLPLLVFVHGLGGSAAQFAPLLTSLANVGPSLCVDLPGCGLSEFTPTAWEAYSTRALVDLLATIIESYRDVKNQQGVVFIGHSMGCSLSALLATSSQSEELAKNVLAVVALCPKATAISDKEASSFRRLLNIPTFAFDILRAIDRRGGAESKSVKRFVGADAWPVTKELQLRFNEQSKTAVWRRMSYGLLPSKAKAQLPQVNAWARLTVPVLLIAGESDHITPATEVQAIAKAWESHWNQIRSTQKENAARRPSLDLPDPVQLSETNLEGAEETDFLRPPRRVLKTRILPHPAAHSLLFSPSEHRILSGLLQTFLSENVDARLSLGWQLLYLSTEGKWEVKNLAKWQAVDPVSERIGGIFRAMKTMREVDETHCPRVFVGTWASSVHAVVDISHESPVYDPAGLEGGGVQYHKFPTVSKLPPSRDEVKGFNELIDRLRSEIASKSSTAGANAHASRGTGDGNGSGNARGNEAALASNRQGEEEGRKEDKAIAVHCHYGFNRTGFFIVCYLVEREGWRLQDALDEFERLRPPGIKHDYFVDTLFARYSVGIKRTPTL